MSPTSRSMTRIPTTANQPGIGRTHREPKNRATKPDPKGAKCVRGRWPAPSGMHVSDLGPMRYRGHRVPRARWRSFDVCPTCRRRPRPLPGGRIGRHRRQHRTSPAALGASKSTSSLFKAAHPRRVCPQKVHLIDEQPPPMLVTGGCKLPTCCGWSGSRSAVGDRSYGVGVRMRYRYRIEPTPAQKMELARVFGCCRLVFNDALRVRDEAHKAGVKLSDTEIQRRVITKAKTTVERCWLTDVPSVALVQAVNDSRRAWRNFFDSRSGKRRRRTIGRPRMKSKKDHRQSFRLTRNGFRVCENGRLFLA